MWYAPACADGSASSQHGATGSGSTPPASPRTSARIRSAVSGVAIHRGPRSGCPARTTAGSAASVSRCGPLGAAGVAAGRRSSLALISRNRQRSQKPCAS